MLKQRRSQDQLIDWPPVQVRSTRPHLPPFPINYEAAVELDNGNYEPKPVSAVSSRTLQGQRHLSKSLGANLQQQCGPLDNRTRCLSAGDLLGKSHEQLLLLLIQLKRNQAQLSRAIDQFRVQLESEQKMALLQPLQAANHRSIEQQLHQRMLTAQKQFTEQGPIIEMIENAIRGDYQQRQAGGSSKSEQNLVAAMPNDSMPILQSTGYAEYRPLATMSNENQINGSIIGLASPAKQTFSSSTVASLDRSTGSAVPSTLEGLRQHRQKVENELEQTRCRMDETTVTRPATETRKSSLDQDTSSLLGLGRSNASSTLHQSVQYELESIEKAIQGLTAKKQKLMENLKKNESKSSDVEAANETAVNPLNEKSEEKRAISLKNAVQSQQMELKTGKKDSSGIDTLPIVVDDHQNPRPEDVDQCVVEAGSSDDLLASELDDLRTDNLSEMEDDLSRLTLYENEFVQTLKAEHEQSERLKAQNAAKLADREAVKETARPSTSGAQEMTFEMYSNRKSGDPGRRTRASSSQQDLGLETDQRDWREITKGELLGNRISQLLFDSSLGIYDQLQPHHYHHLDRHHQQQQSQKPQQAATPTSHSHHHAQQHHHVDAELLMHNQTLLDVQNKLQAKKRRKSRKERVSGSNETMLEEDVYTG